MPYTSIAVANYFVSKSMETGKELTPMKLLKLVYLAHGWHLAITNSPLIGEAVEAWRYGPVVPSVYHAFKKYADKQITSMYTSEPDKFPIINDDATTKILDKIWTVYEDFKGWNLSAMTHQPGSPWDKVWNAQNGKYQISIPIPNEVIKGYYQALAQRTDGNTTTKS